jgi:hypothetical protein
MEEAVEVVEEVCSAMLVVFGSEKIFLSGWFG